MARFVQTTAPNVESALQIAEDLLQKGYQKSELQFVADADASDDQTSLKYEGIDVRYVETKDPTAWEAVKEAIRIDTPSTTLDDGTLDAYREDLQQGRILIVVDSPRAL